MSTEIAKYVFFLISSELTIQEIQNHFQKHSHQIDAAVVLLMRNGDVDLHELADLATAFRGFILDKDLKCREEDFAAAAEARQNEIEIHRKLKLPEPYHALISNEWDLERNIARLQKQLVNLNRIG